MALVLKDRVRETATVVGTGDAALLGAVTGFQAFSVVGNTNTCYYAIADQSGGDWEVGIGTYSTTGPTLARTTVLSSSNAGSKVVFTGGTKDIFLTYPSEKAVYLDAADVVNLTTLDATNVEVTNIKAKDGTAAITLADSTGVATFSANPILNAGTANGVAYLNGSKVLTTGSALTFDGSTFTARSVGLIYPTSGTATLILLDGATTNQLVLTNSGTGAVIRTNDYVPLSFGTNDLERYKINSDGTSIWTIGSEQMRLTSTGLGIGTSSSTSKLSVQGGSLPTGSSGYSVNISSSLPATRLATDAASHLSFIGNYYDDAAIEISQGVSSGYTSGIVIAARNATSTAPDAITLYTRSTERMRIDSSGNLGLGVTPSAWVSYKAIQVQDASFASSNGGDTQITANAYAGSGSWTYLKSGVGATRYVMDGQHRWFTAPSGTAGNAISFTQAMTLTANGGLCVGTTVDPGSGSINLKNGGFVGWGGLESLIYGDSTGGYMYFRTNTAERMRIDSSGNLLINTTTGSYKLTLNGQPGANGYTAWTNYSDARLKENVTDFTTETVLDKVCSLRPVTFNYNDKTGFDEETRQRRISGFIAQELQQVFPDMVGAVEINGDEYMDTNLSNLTLYLLQAVKELSAKVAALEAK